MRVLYLSHGSPSLGMHDHKFLQMLCQKGYDTYLVSYSVEDVAHAHSSSDLSRLC